MEYNIELEKRNRTLRDFFNDKAESYDEVHASLMDTKDILVEAIPADAEKILDIGVGTGLELIGLFEKIPDARVVGIDMCEKMLAILKQRSFADQVDIIQGNFLRWISVPATTLLFQAPCCIIFRQRISSGFIEKYSML